MTGDWFLPCNLEKFRKQNSNLQFPDEVQGIFILSKDISQNMLYSSLYFLDICKSLGGGKSNYKKS